MSAAEVREAEARAAAYMLVNRLAAIAGNLEDAEKDPPLAADGLDDQALADATAVVQDLKRRLSGVERDLVGALAVRRGAREGYLSDGRRYDLHRSAVRKSWDHDNWQRDVRRVVADQVLADLANGDSDGRDLFVVNAATGETAGALGRVLQQAITEAQAVHGSAAPKTRDGLKRLGLDPADYCEQKLGGWNMTTTDPSDTPEISQEN